MPWTVHWSILPLYFSDRYFSKPAADDGKDDNKEGNFYLCRFGQLLKGYILPNCTPCQYRFNCLTNILDAEVHLREDLKKLTIVGDLSEHDISSQDELSQSKMVEIQMVKSGAVLDPNLEEHLRSIHVEEMTKNKGK